jgi:hypothetical protein
MITLTAGAVLSFAVGGGTVETDDHAAAVGVAVDWTRETATLTFNYGTWAAPAFTPGVRPPVVTVTLDLARGGWMSSTGAIGQLTPAQLSTVVSTLTNVRNTAEGFASGPAGGFLPGVTTAW